MENKIIYKKMINYVQFINNKISNTVIDKLNLKNLNKPKSLLGKNHSIILYFSKFSYLAILIYKINFCNFLRRKYLKKYFYKRRLATKISQINN